jgi:hypothetical protein
MMKVLALFFIISTAEAYVPTVESLFRHGANPEVTANGQSVTLVVKKVLPGGNLGQSVNDVSLLKDEKAEDFYKIFFTKAGDSLKVAQTRYSDSKFSETSLEHKTYHSNFSALSIKPSIEEAEKGIFFGLLHSLVLNDGSYLVNYLKSLGVPVKLNEEIINREKIDFLANYKRYLITISKDRNARKTEINPMRPEDPTARSRADQIMADPMYVDTKNVKLARDEGWVAWVVNAGPFEAVASYRNREIQRIKYKSPAGEFEIVCKDYWLANGTHSLPRFILVKTLTGETYQVELVNLRHYVEKEDDMIKRLKNWDQILKGRASTDLRPVFLL